MTRHFFVVVVTTPDEDGDMQKWWEACDEAFDQYIELNDARAEVTMLVVKHLVSVDKDGVQ